MTLTRFHLHLVSDSTGDTVHSVARACLVQFDETQAIEHVWSMVRTRAQIERVIAGIEANPGLVLFTMVNEALRQILQEGCRQLQSPAIPVLDPVIGALGAYLGRESRGLPGKQHLLDSEYFARIDAMTFAITHDDGQSPWGINDADVCLVGVSRSSKTPTCLYLANRGIKAANVPFVPSACGLVKVSSVGMFGAIFAPCVFHSRPPSHRVPVVSFTSSSVPGPRSSTPARASFVSFAERRAIAVTWSSHAFDPAPSLSLSRQNQRKSCASRRFPSSGDRSG